MWRKKPIELPPTGVPFILCGLKVWDLLSEKVSFSHVLRSIFLNKKRKSIENPISL